MEREHFVASELKIKSLPTILMTNENGVIINSFSPNPQIEKIGSILFEVIGKSNKNTRDVVIN